jgi:thymidylate kinase
MNPSDPSSAALSASLAMVLRTSISNSAFTPPSTYAASLAHFKGKIIGLDGIPCAGKTHLGRALREHFRENGVAAVFLEEKMNPVHLAAFYKAMGEQQRQVEEEKKKPEKDRKKPDPNPHSFSLQLCAMMECIQIYKEAVTLAGRGEGGGKAHVVIIDRPVWGNRVFEQLQVAKGNITAEQHEIYDSYIIKHGPYTFDHLVFLWTTPEKAHYRVVSVRKTPSELGVPLEYLRELELVYYGHLHRHLEQGDRALVVVANEDAYCSAERIVETLMQHKPTPKVERSAEEVVSTPGGVAKVLERLCAHYAP